MLNMKLKKNLIVKNGLETTTQNLKDSIIADHQIIIQAIQAVANRMGEEGVITSTSVIASPHKDLIPLVLNTNSF